MISSNEETEESNARESIDSDDDLDTHLLGILDMLHKIAASNGEDVQILSEVNFGQRLSRRDIGSSSVHLESSDRSNENNGIGNETGDSTLDVAELLHSVRKVSIKRE